MARHHSSNPQLEVSGGTLSPTIQGASVLSSCEIYQPHLALAKYFDPGHGAPETEDLVTIALEECLFHDRLTPQSDVNAVAADTAAAAIETWCWYYGPMENRPMHRANLIRALIADAHGEIERQAAIEATEDDAEAAYGDWVFDGRGFGR